MALYYNFNDKLIDSKSKETVVCRAMQLFFPGCKIEQEECVALDKRGRDYRVILPNKDVFALDHKNRDPGCSKYWKNGEPELAPEVWSKIPEPGIPGQVGWMLDHTKITDYVLCTFDASDTELCYLALFSEYRELFENNYDSLKLRYRVATQVSDGWKSECIFVPVSALVNLGLRLWAAQLNRR